MLETLAHLQDLHVRIKNATTKLSTTHCSMVCRAASSSIADVHLGHFVDKVIQVESSILQKDAAYVGAYEIVPLSTLVAEFAPWTRRLDWLWSIVERLDPNADRGEGKRPASGADTLDLLERETHTGYSDIKDMAMAILIVSQRAWMRSASLWVLYGKLPTSGAEDFCIKPNPRPSSAMDAFMIDHTLVPKFVNTGASSALLSIGTALSQLRSQTPSVAGSLKGSNDPSMSLLPAHLGLLESLGYPLNPSLLENVLTSINQSISENVLSQILPRPLVMQLLQVILRYVLLDRGEFAVSLVAHADARVKVHQPLETAARPVRKFGRLDDLAVKEVEVNGVLNKTMTEMATLQADDDNEDDIQRFAKKLLSLKTIDDSADPLLVSTLLPTPTLLYITILPSSPLHIFLSKTDIRTYARINAYLLSLHRAGLHLSALWKLSSHRRCHPTPLGPPRSTSRAGQASLAARRSRDARRSARTRRHWSCASKALFTINELEAYLQGEVIQCSWIHFRKWLTGEERTNSPSTRSSRPGTASSVGMTLTTDISNGGAHPRPSDPRAVAEAHRRYLLAINTALFATDASFIALLKDLLNQIDHLVALFHRLQAVWEGLDLQEDDGVVDAFSNYAQDEKDVLAEMDRTSSVIDTALMALVVKIREVEKEKQTGVGVNNMVESLGDAGLDDIGFVPWQARTVDRLVMKLDSLAGKQAEDRDDIVVGIMEGYDDE